MRLLCLIDQALFRLVSAAVQILLLAAVAAGFFQVVARFVLHSPLDWSEVATRAIIIWTVLLGTALAFRHGAMISVDMLRSIMARRGLRWFSDIIALTCMSFLLFLAWIGGQMTWRVRFQTVPSLDISISWIYLAIPVGATLAAIGVLAHWVEQRRQPLADPASSVNPDTP